MPLCESLQTSVANVEKSVFRDPMKTFSITWLDPPLGRQARRPKADVTTAWKNYFNIIIKVEVIVIAIIVFP